MNIGEKIKSLRKINGLTQQELGSKVGVSAISIRKYESGDRTPSKTTLKVISDIFNISVNELLNGVSEYDKNEVQDDAHNCYSSQAYTECLEKLSKDIRFEYWDDRLRMFTPYGSMFVSPQIEKDFIQRLNMSIDSIIKSILYDLSEVKEDN